MTLERGNEVAVVRYMMIGLVLAGAILILWEIRRENRRFVTTYYKIQTDKLKNVSFRIAFLSDLHGKEYGEENRDLIREIRKAAPDYILIGGDMLVGSKEIPGEKAAKFVEQLPEIAPVYYANGNHEQRIRQNPEYVGTMYEEYKERLERSGVKFLVNDSVRWNIQGNTIRVTGTEIPGDCFKRLVHQELCAEDVEEQVGSAEKESYQILLAHHPKFAEEYKKWGADLILSGHLHGGVARFPIRGGIGVISPQIHLFPKYSGDLYDLGDGSKIVVSKGLGTHTINVRFFNPAELIILDITGKN